MGITGSGTRPSWLPVHNPSPALQATETASYRGWLAWLAAQRREGPENDSMNRAQALAAIESAATVDEVIAALREHSRAGGLASRLIPSGLAEPDEVADLAFELTRLRTRLPHEDADLVGLETLYARAAVRLSEILDPKGHWESYRIRDGRRGGEQARRSL